MKFKKLFFRVDLVLIQVNTHDVWCKSTSWTTWQCNYRATIWWVISLLLYAQLQKWSFAVKKKCNCASCWNSVQNKINAFNISRTEICLGSSHRLIIRTTWQLMPEASFIFSFHCFIKCEKWNSKNFVFHFDLILLLVNTHEVCRKSDSWQDN